MIAWKVIRKEFGKRISAYAGCFDSNASFGQEYLKGKMVKEVEGSLGIFCFKKKIDAKKFRHTFSWFEIIKVRGINPKPRSELFHGIPNNDFSFKKWYKNPTGVKAFSVPIGTVCFEKVKVLE